MTEQGWTILVLEAYVVATATKPLFIRLGGHSELENESTWTSVWFFIGVVTLLGGWLANSWSFGLPVVGTLNMQAFVGGLIAGALAVAVYHVLVTQVVPMDYAKYTKLLVRGFLALSLLLYFLLAGVGWIRHWLIGVVWLCALVSIYVLANIPKPRIEHGVVTLLAGVTVGGCEWLALFLWFKLRSTDFDVAIRDHAFDILGAAALVGASLYFPKEPYLKLLWFTLTMASIGALTAFSVNGGWSGVLSGLIAGITLGAWMFVGSSELTRNGARGSQAASAPATVAE